jgi:hypothetical protein
MPKFRKKPVVIEATQVTESVLNDRSLWPAWLSDVLAESDDDCETEGMVFLACPGSPMANEGFVMGVNTLEGTHLVRLNDWIIQGVKGELYPCKPDIFEATYEAA